MNKDKHTDYTMPDICSPCSCTGENVL